MPVMEISPSARLEKWFRVFSREQHCVWLDSADGYSGADWSVLAANPVEVRSGEDGDLLEWMREWEERLREVSVQEVPFTGGLIGQIDYKADMPAFPPETIPRISGWMGLYDRALVEHRLAGRVYAVVADWVDDSEMELTRWAASLTKITFSDKVAQVRASRPVPDQSGDQYQEGVRRVREWIASGDIYQANLSQRFQCEIIEGDAVELYQALRRENPAPYSAFIDCGGRQILSSSPELFLSISADRKIYTRPIKGTRPRSDEPAVDRDLAEGLRFNEKERAELLMIVDMERNDLGRVCEMGSVTAGQEFTLESFTSVHHLVGEVSGKLRDGVTIADVFAAAFPGGSITGAPKKRAMEIIGSLEPSRRRAYCGTIGFLAAGGVSRWNIAIRTMELIGTQVEFGVGAGIVWDSDPVAEYEETLHKARKIFASLGWSTGKVQENRQ